LVNELCGFKNGEIGRNHTQQCHNGTPDMTIISGHQRAKAAKENGINLVPIIIREDLDNEDIKLKALIAANFGRS